jgi:hypothetical protein
MGYGLIHQHGIYGPLLKPTPETVDKEEVGYAAERAGESLRSRMENSTLPPGSAFFAGEFPDESSKFVKEMDEPFRDGSVPFNTRQSTGNRELASFTYAASDVQRRLGGKQEHYVVQPGPTGVDMVFSLDPATGRYVPAGPVGAQHPRHIQANPREAFMRIDRSDYWVGGPIPQVPDTPPEPEFFDLDTSANPHKSHFRQMDARAQVIGRPYHGVGFGMRDYNFLRGMSKNAAMGRG